MVKVSWFTKGWLVYIYLILNILNSYTRSTISKRVDTLNVIFLLYYSSAQVCAQSYEYQVLEKFVISQLLHEH